MGETILSDVVYRPRSLEGLRGEAATRASEIPTMDVGITWAYAVEMQPAESAFPDFLRAANANRALA